MNADEDFFMIHYYLQKGRDSRSLLRLLDPRNSLEKQLHIASMYKQIEDDKNALDEAEAKSH